MKKLVLLCVVLLTVSPGCKNNGDGSTETAGSAGGDEEATEKSSDESGESQDEGESAASERESEGSEAGESGDQSPEEAGEQAEATNPTDYDAGALPEAVDSENVVDKGLKWRDKEGENLLVFERETTTEQQEGRKPALTDVVLTVTHWRQTTARDWEKVRTFKERVDQCPFDSEITPMVGDWSLTDLDEDGLEEATFAYSAACRSDMSAATHKVIMTEDGQKRVLRGKTVLAIPNPDEPMEQGEITDEEGFEDGDEALRDHAGSVWEKTSNELASMND